MFFFKKKNSLPAGGFMKGGGINGTIMGTFPWSFDPADESESPFPVVSPG